MDKYQEELTSILCSSYTEKKDEEEQEKEEKEVERVGHETLDEDIKVREHVASLVHA